MPSTKRKRTTTKSATATAASPPSPPSPSAEKVAENNDVLADILLHLPIKSLQRFKSVSKNWLSLISTPAFSARRTPHPSPNISGLILKLSELHVGYAGPEYDFVDPNQTQGPNGENFSNPPPFRSLTFVDEYRSGIEILQSCNGLLLCRTSRVRELRTSYYVYNPATRKYFTVLPRPQVRRGKRNAEMSTVNRMSLAFDPSKSPHYKVVCLRKSEEIVQERFWMEIYSSETRSWRSSSVGSFAAEFNFTFASGVYWNGSVHWINPRCPSLRFNVDEDRLCEMPMPVPQDNNMARYFPCDGGFAYFGESRGHLHLVYRRFEPGTTCFNVYEMEKDYSGWFVKYRVDLAEVSAASPEMVPRYSVISRPPLEVYYLSVLCVVRCEQEEDSYLVLYIPGKIFRYNLKSETFYKLCDIEPKQAPNQRFHNSREFSRWSEAYQYIESLASV